MEAPLLSLGAPGLAPICEKAAPVGSGVRFFPRAEDGDPMPLYLNGKLDQNSDETRKTASLIYIHVFHENIEDLTAPLRAVDTL